MEDHKHEWAILDSWPDRDEDLQAECFWGWKESGYKIQCPATLDEKEINRRLNATDRLSAEDAKALIDLVIPAWHTRKIKASKAAEAYAAALEEE